jgi:hypothetical protein
MRLEFSERFVGQPPVQVIGCLACQKIEEAQLAFIRTMRLREMRGNHADNLAAAAEQRRRLHGAEVTPHGSGRIKIPPPDPQYCKIIASRTAVAGLRFIVRARRRMAHA